MAEIVTDDRAIEFTVNGRSFLQSVDDAQSLIRELQHKVEQRQKIPYDRTITYWEISEILLPHYEATGGDAVSYGIHFINHIIWLHVCRDAKNSMYCPSCFGTPQCIREEHPTLQWDISIDSLIDSLKRMLNGKIQYDNDGSKRKAVKYLRANLKNR